MIPPPLWNNCDSVLHFTSTITHIPGKMNTATDSLSRLEMDPNVEKVLKIRKVIPNKRIEVNVESTGIAQENVVPFYTADRQETTKGLWKRKKEARKAIPIDPRVITVSCYYANDLHKNTANVKKAQLTKRSRIAIEQDLDPTLLNFKRDMLSLPFDEQFLLNNARYMHCSRNRKRIIIKDVKLCRQYYNDLGEVIHVQFTLPGKITQFVTKIITRNSWQTPRHFKNGARNSTEVLLPFNSKYFINWVRDCEICIQDQRI